MLSLYKHLDDVVESFDAKNLNIPSVCTISYDDQISFLSSSSTTSQTNVDDFTQNISPLLQLVFEKQLFTTNNNNNISVEQTNQNENAEEELNTTPHLETARATVHVDAFGTPSAWPNYSMMMKNQNKNDLTDKEHEEGYAKRRFREISRRVISSLRNLRLTTGITTTTTTTQQSNNESDENENERIQNSETLQFLRNQIVIETGCPRFFGLMKRCSSSSDINSNEQQQQQILLRQLLIILASSCTESFLNNGKTTAGTSAMCDDGLNLVASIFCDLLLLLQEGKEQESSASSDMTTMLDCSATYILLCLYRGFSFSSHAARKLLQATTSMNGNNGNSTNKKTNKSSSVAFTIITEWLRLQPSQALSVLLSTNDATQSLVLGIRNQLAQNQQQQKSTNIIHILSCWQFFLVTAEAGLNDEIITSLLSDLWSSALFQYSPIVNVFLSNNRNKNKNEHDILRVTTMQMFSNVVSTAVTTIQQQQEKTQEQEQKSILNLNGISGLIRVLTTFSKNQKERNKSSTTTINENFKLDFATLCDNLLNEENIVGPVETLSQQLDSSSTLSSSFIFDEITLLLQVVTEFFEESECFSTSQQQQSKNTQQLNSIITTDEDENEQQDLFNATCRRIIFRVIDLMWMLVDNLLLSLPADNNNNNNNDDADDNETTTTRTEQLLQDVASLIEAQCNTLDTCISVAIAKFSFSSIFPATSNSNNNNLNPQKQREENEQEQENNNEVVEDETTLLTASSSSSVEILELLHSISSSAAQLARDRHRYGKMTKDDNFTRRLVIRVLLTIVRCCPNEAYVSSSSSSSNSVATTSSNNNNNNNTLNNINNMLMMNDTNALLSTSNLGGTFSMFPSSTSNNNKNKNNNTNNSSAFSSNIIGLALEQSLVIIREITLAHLASSQNNNNNNKNENDNNNENEELSQITKTILIPQLISASGLGAARDCETASRGLLAMMMATTKSSFNNYDDDDEEQDQDQQEEQEEGLDADSLLPARIFLEQAYRAIQHPFWLDQQVAFLLERALLCDPPVQLPQLGLVLRILSISAQFGDAKKATFEISFKLLRSVFSQRVNTVGSFSNNNNNNIADNDVNENENDEEQQTSSSSSSTATILAELLRFQVNRTRKISHLLAKSVANVFSFSSSASSATQQQKQQIVEEERMNQQQQEEEAITLILSAAPNQILELEARTYLPLLCQLLLEAEKQPFFLSFVICVARLINQLVESGNKFLLRELFSSSSNHNNSNTNKLSLLKFRLLKFFKYASSTSTSSTTISQQDSFEARKAYDAICEASSSCDISLNSNIISTLQKEYDEIFSNEIEKVESESRQDLLLNFLKETLTIATSNSNQQHQQEQEQEGETPTSGRVSGGHLGIVRQLRSDQTPAKQQQESEFFDENEGALNASPINNRSENNNISRPATAAAARSRDNNNSSSSRRRNNNTTANTNDSTQEENYNNLLDEADQHELSQMEQSRLDLRKERDLNNTLLEQLEAAIRRLNQQIEEHSAEKYSSERYGSKATLLEEEQRMFSQSRSKTKDTEIRILRTLLTRRTAGLIELDSHLDLQASIQMPLKVLVASVNARSQLQQEQIDQLMHQLKRHDLDSSMLRSRTDALRLKENDDMTRQIAVLELELRKTKQQQKEYHPTTSPTNKK